MIFEFVLKLKLVNRSENPKNIPTFVLFLRRMNKTDYQKKKNEKNTTYLRQTIYVLI